MICPSSLAMQHYLIHPIDQIFVKGYGFFMGKNVGKNISKNVSSKYSQKLLDHAKQSATDALKTALKKERFKKQRSSGRVNWR